MKHIKTQYLFLFHDNNDYANASRHYVARRLPAAVQLYYTHSSCDGEVAAHARVTTHCLLSTHSTLQYQHFLRTQRAVVFLTQQHAKVGVVLEVVRKDSHTNLQRKCTVSA